MIIVSARTGITIHNVSTRHRIETHIGILRELPG